MLQPLVVRRTSDDGPNQIVAGNRRYRALKKIAGKKDIDVPVMIANSLTDADAYTRSLIENVVRKNLHPVDEYDAYKKMIDEWWSVEQIAELFGVKEKWVRQRLQLAKLSPNLRAAWRLGTLSEDQAAALSAAESHERQEAIWKEASRNGGYYSSAKELRTAIARDSIKGDDSRVAFIGGIDAYTARGGTMTEDLFADHKALKDRDLVDAMILERLNALADEKRADGWAFVRVDQYSSWNELIDLRPWMNDKQRAAYEKNAYDKAGLAAKAAAVEAAIADPEARAKSGVVVTRKGAEASFEYLVAPDGADDEASGEGEAVDEERSSIETGDAKSPDQRDPDAKVNYALRETVSEWVTLAMADAMAKDPHVTLAALTATLEYSLKCHDRGATPLRISTSEAWAGLAGERDFSDGSQWLELFKTIVGESDQNILVRLSRHVARTVDFRIVRYDQHGSGGYMQNRQSMLEALTAETSLGDLNKALDARFDRAAYFDRVSKNEINSALTEMGVAGKRPGKKAALAELAAAKAKETGWLPVDLRLPGLLALRKKTEG